jgi:rhamnose transport system substrate-binding protein
MKKFLCVALAALLAATGCAGAGNVNPLVPPETDDGVLTIYFIPKDVENPYFHALSSGFYNAVTELGEENFRYEYIGPPAPEADNQREYVEEALAGGADAIFIAANSNTALNDLFDKARAAGVRVYCVNSDIPGSEEHRDAAILPVDFNSIGKAQIELLAAQIDYRGQFAILSATPDAPDQNLWVSMMKEELSNNAAYRDMELVGVVYGDDQPEKSAAETEALLEKYPDLRGIIAPTTVGLAAACRVGRERGAAERVKITGLGLPSEMAEFVLDGTCEAFHLWNPPAEGYLSVYLVWAEEYEGFVPAPGAKFSAGALGEFEVQPGSLILTLKTPMLYNAENIRQYAVQF